MDFNQVEWSSGNLDDFLGSSQDASPMQYTFGSSSEAKEFLSENFYKTSNSHNILVSKKDALVNKAGRDYWVIEAEGAGGITVRRLIDPNDSSVIW